METPPDSPRDSVSPVSATTSRRHSRDVSTQSLLSAVSSHASDMNSAVSSAGASPASVFGKSTPQYKMQKLIKSSLKHSLKTKDKLDDTNIEYWDAFYRKLRRTISLFPDPLSLYDALNNPYSGKPGKAKQTCSSIIHILCKQFYLYARSNNWEVCFKIYDCIKYTLDKGANTSIFYTKLNEAPQRNYNSIHTLYQGLLTMLNAEVITHKQFVNYFSRAISAGNEYIQTALVSDMNAVNEESEQKETNANSDSETSKTDANEANTDGNEESGDSEAEEEDSNDEEEPCEDSEENTEEKTEETTEEKKEEMSEEIIIFDPAVLTLCVYEVEDEEAIDIENITYWMGDCMYHDQFVHLLSPYLTHAFLMMGYELFHIIEMRMDELDYSVCTDEEDVGMTDLLVRDEKELHFKFHGQDDIYNKVIAFLWFIRFGNFKADLVHIIDVGIKQLAFNEFEIEADIIEKILEYSHGYIMSHTNAEDSRLELPYFRPNKYMTTAFDTLFKLDTDWIDWIGEYVMPKLSKAELSKIKKKLSSHTSQKQWNKFIRRISLKAISSFSNIFGTIDTLKMQSIILKHFRNNDLINVLANANYDTVQAFGSNGVLYQILNNDSMDKPQIQSILHAVHVRIEHSCGENNEMECIKRCKLIINDFLFGTEERWKKSQSIWRNLLIMFDGTIESNKYKYFKIAFNDLFYELTTEQHHSKLIFFMENNVIDFDYCLKKDLLNLGLQSLIVEDPFSKKASCVQMIGDWIYAHFEKEENESHKQYIAQKFIKFVSNITKVALNQQDTVIIQQYLNQLKTALSK